MKKLLLLVLLSVSVAWCEPDQRGDYRSNEGPVSGTAASPMSAGSLWVVVADWVPCRHDPDPDSKLITRFKKGTILQADIGRGGSDEVLVNALDRNGRPWMRVRDEQGNDFDGYVRAHIRYIKPLEKD